MSLRCGGKLNKSFIANFQQIVTLEICENRPVFDEVMPKILLVRFLRTRCIFLMAHQHMIGHFVPRKV